MVKLKAKSWEATIKKQMEAVGTYRESFQRAISTLATILEQRDTVYEEFQKDGRTVIERVSDRGAVNSAKNPLFVAWMDLNNQALAYWRDLGLTPSGLKKIDEGAMKQKKRSTLAEALAELEKGGAGGG